MFSFSDLSQILLSVKRYIDHHSDKSNLVTQEEYSQLEGICKSHIGSGTLATLNGQSLEDGGNIELDLSLYKIVSVLPTEHILTNKIYLVPSPLSSSSLSSASNTFDEYIYNDTTDPGTWELLGQIHQEIDLSGYLTKAEAESKYMAKGSVDSSNPNAPALSISTTGAFNNFGNNGQAFNAVRNVSSSNKYQSDTGSGFPLNAASFGVKDSGTTAFSHKKYDTFNKNDGSYTGARNTAVLVFSGRSGLLYAKNTGTANDVTDAMYKRVGVIDSPDEEQRVYSASQVDAIIQPLLAKISALEDAMTRLQKNL